MRKQHTTLDGAIETVEEASRPHALWFRELLEENHTHRCKDYREKANEPSHY
jgi:hypothetical protein